MHAFSEAGRIEYVTQSVPLDRPAMASDDEYDAELAAARERNANWGKIGHPVQSRGLSPKDRTPWLTLLATGLICLALGRLFLKLQRNYEADFGLWQGEDGAPSRLAGAPPLVNTSIVPSVTHKQASVVHSASAVTLLAGGVDTEVDASCGAQVNLDLDGFAVSWGLDFKTPTAQACCDACKAHEQRDGQPGKCNSWCVLTRPPRVPVHCALTFSLPARRVWCPEEKCWAPDIWDHAAHECWLKVQDDPAKPKVNHKGDFSAAFRAEHKTAPEKTPWMAGVLS
jgi:hypothetical protein